MADGNIEINEQTVIAIDAAVKKLGTDAKQFQDSAQRQLGEMRGLIDTTTANDTVRDERIAKYAASVETLQANMEEGLGKVSAKVDQALTAINRASDEAGFGDEEAGQRAKDAMAFEKTRMVNAGTLKVGTRVQAKAEEYKAWAENFDLYARRDDKGSHATPDFLAALQTGSDPDGGYLVPVEVSRRIIERAWEINPVRDVASVVTIGGKELEIPRDEGEFGAGWVGETTDRPETSTSQLGVSKITVHEMYAAPRATQNMLEDAAINIPAWMAKKVGDKFGRLEGYAFLRGDGVGKPKGLLTYPAGTTNGRVEQINSGAATDFAFDGLMNTVFSLKDPYENNASWMFNRLGLRNIAKLKDLEGRYIWEMNRNMTTKAPSMLLGYPLRRATDIDAPGAAALMGMFGDFREAYTIVDRLGITTLRDPYTAKPYVIFYSRRRVGGDVVNFEAYKIIVGAA